MDDLISKYARKKAPPPPIPPPTAVSQNHGRDPHGLQRDYSNTSLNKYGTTASSSQNLSTGGASGSQRGSFYGANNLYGRVSTVMNFQA